MDFAASFPGYPRKQVGIFSDVSSARLTDCPHVSNIFFFCFAYFIPNFGIFIMMYSKVAYLNQGGWHIWSLASRIKIIILIMKTARLYMKSTECSVSRETCCPSFPFPAQLRHYLWEGYRDTRAGVTHNLKEGNALCRVMSLKILKYKAERSSSRSDLCSSGQGTSQS